MKMDGTHAAALGRVRLGYRFGLCDSHHPLKLAPASRSAIPTHYEIIQTACMLSSHLPFHTIFSYASSRCSCQSAAREEEQYVNVHIPRRKSIFHQRGRVLGLVVEQRSASSKFWPGVPVPPNLVQWHTHIPRKSAPLPNQLGFGPPNCLVRAAQPATYREPNARRHPEPTDRTTPNSEGKILYNALTSARV